MTNFGEESLEYVETEESIGRILLEKHEFYKAAKRFVRALKVKKKLLGEKCIPVADTYIYIGELFSTNYWFTELLGDAHKKTIEIKEKIAHTTKDLSRKSLLLGIVGNG